MVKAAVFSGADSVYLGLRGFNARRGAGNFDESDLFETVAFCHARRCKVYVALNTLVFAGAETAFANALHTAWRAGCDAAIVQDLAAVPLAKQVAPQLTLHASTQMSVHSLAGVQKLAELGFSRVILARELREEEIAHIAAHAPIELEVFVHGALCMSVSGQCYFSAFLGGRSGNRGACAGPCRLPFCSDREGTKAATTQYALSLKDLSVLEALPRLQKMGVVSAKIEGRLRGAEYVAATVEAALKAREGQDYDADFLREVFSRGAFTRGWYGGKTGSEMLGRRDEQAAVQSRKALPKARELYRRERARVPVDMALRVEQNAVCLRVCDGENTAMKRQELPLALANQPPALEQALQKTGGTPFYAKALQIHNEGRFHVPVSVVNALRRDALQELLHFREQVPVKEPMRTPTLPLPKSTSSRRVQGLCARFSAVAQMPKEAQNRCDVLVFPLSEAAHVPVELRHKTRLSLPRFIKQKEETGVRTAILKAAELGFSAVEAQGVGQWKLCEGVPLTGGFGLNVTNAVSANFLHSLGFSALTLSVELSAAQAHTLSRACAGTLLIEMPAYGHFPLMLTRACPMRQSRRDCETCQGEVFLTDRKGKRFRMSCEEGMRSVYNPVPLWLADRLHECPADRALLYFTNETSEKAKDVLLAFEEGRAGTGNFTRGLFDHGTQA